MTAKKVIRAQNIAIESKFDHLFGGLVREFFCRCRKTVFPTLTISAAVFRNNAAHVRHGHSATHCHHGHVRRRRAYHPGNVATTLLNDRRVGAIPCWPGVVQAAIGQKSSAEELGGAKMHAQISGTVDFSLSPMMTPASRASALL